MLDKSSQAISVGSDQNSLSSLQFRNDFVVPVRHNALQSGRQRFSKLFGIFEPSVTRVTGRVMLAAFIDGRRRNVIRTTPYKNLILSILIDRLLLI